MPSIIPILVFSTLILSAEPNQPTEIIGSAATPDGGRNQITVEQPEFSPNPFGYIAPTQDAPHIIEPAPPINATSLKTQQENTPQPIISQLSTTNPKEMSQNPLDYQDKIENTIYQDGNRLLDVQSIPIKDINTALTPNIEPTVSTYPAW